MNIKIYRDGQYSVRDNLKLKARQKLDRFAYKAASFGNAIDYYFVNHTMAGWNK